MRAVTGSAVSFAFLECGFLREGRKGSFREALRRNRYSARSTRWRYSNNLAQNAVIRSTVKMWWNPDREHCNQTWGAAHGLAPLLTPPRVPRVEALAWSHAKQWWV